MPDRTRRRARRASRAASRPRCRRAGASRAAVASGTPTATRSASGSLAMTRSASDRRGEGEREVHRARLLRVRERDGREVGIGVRLLGDDVHVGEPGVGEDRARGLEPDAVHRRVDVAQRRGRGAGASDAAVAATYASTTSLAGDRVRRSSAGSSAIEPRGDRARSAACDLGVGGRHDLRARVAAAEVDLVAVVGGRVVRRGHHDAGDARRGAAPRTPARASAAAAAAGSRCTPAPCMSSAVSRAKTRRVVAAVVADDDRRIRLPRRAGRRRARRRPATTSTRFIRVGPAPSSPRSPAVPNSSRPAKRAARSATATASPGRRAATSASSSARVTGSGSCAIQARGERRARRRSAQGASSTAAPRSARAARRAPARRPCRPG